MSEEKKDGAGSLVTECWYCANEYKRTLPYEPGNVCERHKKHETEVFEKRFFKGKTS